LLLDEVPLVDGDEQTFAHFLGLLQDADILALQSFNSIQHKHCYIALLDGPLSPQRGVELHVLFDAGFLSESCRVDQHDLSPFEFDHGVDGIAGSAADLCDDRPWKSENGIREGRLADVWLADDGDTEDIVLFGSVGLFRERGDQVVEQLSRAHSVDGGDGIDLSKPQLVELGGLPGALLVIRLVRHGEDRFPGFPEDAGQFIVELGRARRDVHDENYSVGFLDGDVDLLADGRLEGFRGTGYESTRVDNIESRPGPLHLPVDAIARDAWLIVHDGPARLYAAVGEGRLPHVGAADDRDERHGELKAFFAFQIQAPEQHVRRVRRFVCKPVVDSRANRRSSDRNGLPELTAQEIFGDLAWNVPVLLAEGPLYATLVGLVVGEGSRCNADFAECVGLGVATAGCSDVVDGEDERPVLGASHRESVRSAYLLDEAEIDREQERDVRNDQGSATQTGSSA